MPLKSHRMDMAQDQLNYLGAIMSNPVTRLKLYVNTVSRGADHNGAISQEQITFSAVMSDKEGAANKEWSKWTPSAQLNFTVTNPAVFGKILPGQFYYVDLTLTDKDSL